MRNTRSDGFEIDLLRPEQRSRRRDRPERCDVEDAEFETIYPAEAKGAANARLAPHAAFARTDPARAGPLRQQGAAANGRSSLFADSRRAGLPKRFAAPMALAGVFGCVCLALLLVTVVVSRAPDADLPEVVHTGSIPAQEVIRRAPVADSDIAVRRGDGNSDTQASRPMPPEDAPVAEAEAPAPRPARIERAGSILMIRSGGS